MNRKELLRHVRAMEWSNAKLTRELDRCLIELMIRYYHNPKRTQKDINAVAAFQQFVHKTLEVKP